MWLAWQGYRDGNLDILVAAQRGRVMGPATRASFSPRGDWEPALAAGPQGDIALTWDTYDKGDYDVYVRRMRYDRMIRMDEPIPVAVSAAFEARGSVAFDPQDRLWVAWEQAGENWGKDLGMGITRGSPLYQGHVIQVAVLDGGKVLRDKMGLSAVMLGVREAARGRKVPRRALNSHPRLAVDPSGMVYLAWRELEPTGHGTAGFVWNENLTWLKDSKWWGPARLPHTDQGLDQRPALEPIGRGRLLVVAASDHRLPCQAARPDNALPAAPDSVQSDIYAMEVVPDTVSSDTPVPGPLPETADLVQPDAPSVATLAELAVVERLRNAEIRTGLGTYVLARGESHRHTDLSSDGGTEGPLMDAYRYFIDVASLDWAACCDHEAGTRENAWYLNQQYTDAFRLAPDFLTLFMYERSYQYPMGHRNLLFERRGIRPLPRARMGRATDTGPPADTMLLYRFLHEYNGITVAHTTATISGTDWKYVDTEVEPVVEIFQGLRGSYEALGAPLVDGGLAEKAHFRPDGLVVEALNKGVHLGFIASSDHGSTHLSYANLWVKTRDRAGLMEALRSRRVYASTDNILADVRCGSHLMGEAFSLDTAPTLDVDLVGTAPFERVVIIRNGEEVHEERPGTEKVTFHWTDPAAPMGESYYYVRGEQVDGNVVWVSPMWVTRR